MKKVKIGIIGAGSIARKHLEAIQRIDWLEVVGITSRTKSKAAQLAKEFNILLCADDIKLLIAEAKPDALMVLVSIDQICKVVSKVVPYGLPLFIEKPVGLSPEENLKLVKLAQKYSVRSMVGFNRRYYSVFHKGLQIIRDHGPLMGLAIEGHERMWLHRKSTKRSEQILSSWIFANSVHTIDLLRFFGGEPKQIKTLAHRYLEPRGDQFAAIMEFDSGAMGNYHAHWYSPGGWSVVLYGNGVTVKFCPLEKGCWIDKQFKTHEIEPDETDVNSKPGFIKQLEAFGKMVRDGLVAWPLQDLEGSYKTMLLAEQLSANLSDRGQEFKNKVIKKQ